MTIDSSDPSRCIWVATDCDDAFVRIKGQASFSTGPTLKQLGAVLIDGLCKRLVLDMEDCQSVDSTFLGVLAGLSSRLKKSAGTPLIMINLSPGIYETVCVLGLNHVINCFKSGECPKNVQENLRRLGTLNRVEIQQVDAKTARETAIEAHENLILSDRRNLSKFKDVLTFLRETQPKRQKQ